MAKPFIVSSADFKKRPFLLRALNILWGASYPIGTKVKLDFDKILKAARKKTGLQDFGSTEFEEPLKKLLKSTDEEAMFTPFGRFVCKERFTGILCNRLRAQYYFKKHPEILDIEIEAPIVISGLQRTGTTFLHRLLASDKSIRALHSWEAMNPAPFINEKNTSARIKEAKIAEKALRFMSKSFFAIHPVQHNAPEEEVLLLDNTFLSTVSEATANVPSYAAWNEQQDQVPAYAYLKKMLQLLTWQNGGNRWVLKSPHHLEFLDDLLKVFPDAKLIQTHRNPLTTVASFSSMVAYSRYLFSDDVDAEVVGKHWLRKINRMVTKALETRERIGDDNFLDVFYTDLIEDPAEQAKRIYSYANVPFTRDTEQSIKDMRSNNKQHKYGIHKYALKDFNLTDEQVSEILSAYINHFNLQ